MAVDNASSNNGIINYLKRKTKHRKWTILEHDYLHTRCGAHILNLIVSDGLKEMDESIVKIRNVVRYVRSSPSRMAKFNSCANREGIESKSSVCLDVPTRRNSTFLMLERAVQFEKAFERLQDEDLTFSCHFKSYRNDGLEFRDDSGRKILGAPDSEDWAKARLYVKFLKLFHKATLRFSGSLFVTSNVFYIEIDYIQSAIKNLCENDNINLRLMVEGMRIKFEKY